MKIAAVPVTPAFGTPSSAAAPEVFNLRIQGRFEPTDPAVIRARNLLVAKGSPEMLESFDWAISTGALVRSE